MTRRDTLVAVGMAALLVLAGCAGSSPSADGDAEGGTVNVYLSDQQNAIDDFARLNVTVSAVGLVPDDDSEPVERDVDAFRVDLTELQGANATLMEKVDAPNGTYSQVYVRVSDVDGTLKSGEEAEIELPSRTLRVNEAFTVGDGEAVDFVFDLSVVKAGQSGTYNVRPVTGESGTDVEIDDRDVGREGGEREENGEDERTETEAETDASSAVDLYLSDERNAIDDFAHVNVTVTRVGVHRAGDGEDSGDGSGGWVEKDVSNATVDITTLLGDNATRLETVPAPNGTYDKVFVYVDGIEATLKNGEQVRVKLPSDKLQLKQTFTVGDGETVEFVFDISVFEAGNSGKYILKPVVSESGTDVPIDERGEQEEDDDETGDAPAAPPLNLSLSGAVVAGENVTLTVTADGEAVAGAAVAVNGESIGETGANGTLTVAVPSDAERFEIEVTAGEREAELTRTPSEG
ncbi:MAG: DUF4382 domain-containing protein [Halolamina sp.]